MSEIKFILSLVSTELAAAVVLILLKKKRAWSWILAYWIVTFANNFLSLMQVGSML